MMRYCEKILNRKNQYTFNNYWKVDAPLALVWKELMDYQKWPAWCVGLERVEKLDSFEHLQKGNTIRSSWRGSLPYTITIDAFITDFLHPSSLSFTVTGDLSGEGVCCFLCERENSVIHFTWNVSPTKPWMKLGAFFARPVFIENHNHILEQAITGFTRMVADKQFKDKNHGGKNPFKLLKYRQK